MDTTQLLKGVLDLAVLAAVAREDGYGYDLLQTGGRDQLQRSAKTWRGFAATLDSLLGAES